MTRVEIIKKGEEITAFRVEGHTGFEDSGQDIVCAGVSAIVQTALAGLLKYLDKKPLYKRSEGLLSCCLPRDLSDEDKAKVSLILGTMELGLQDIEHHYGDYVKLITWRC